MNNDFINNLRKMLSHRRKHSTLRTRRRRKCAIILGRLVGTTAIILSFTLCFSVLGYVVGIIKTTPSATTVSIKPKGNFTSFIYDSKGNQIDTFTKADNISYVSIDEIPKHLQHAFIALEDKRFYQHNGVDLIGLSRAVVKTLLPGSRTEGASTITQQLIKNNVLSDEKTIERKIREQYLALGVEKLYSKDLILEYYLNTIALGQGTCGVQSASLRYFGKDAKDLSLSESAVIAVITQNPSVYNPIRHPEANKEKADICLKYMLEQGYITKQQYQEAENDNPYLRISEYQNKRPQESTRTYFVDALLKQVAQDLQTKLNYTEVQAYNEIYGGGLQVYSTFDGHLQSIVDKYMSDDSLYPQIYDIVVDYSIVYKDLDGVLREKDVINYLPNTSSIPKWKEEQLKKWGIAQSSITSESLIQQPSLQAAFVLSDQTIGAVRAIYGGRGDKVNSGFNYATQAKRQPGSTFKPLSAYAPAIDLGLMTKESTISDTPLSIPQTNGKPYQPSNWDHKFIGTTSIRRAIYHSMNVAAVRTVYELVGLDNAYNYLQKFGFTTLDETNDKVYALPLGGIYNGVTPLELNSAYATLSNDGVYKEPILYTEIKDKDGNTLLSNIGDNSKQDTHKVVEINTARQMTDLMLDVTRIGTGTTVQRYFNTQPVAGKTGTTTDDVDLLFAGYTPYYTATIWTGFQTPKSLARGGGSYHLKLWGLIMNEVHQGLPRKDFNLSMVTTPSPTNKGEGKEKENSPKDQKDTQQIAKDYTICAETGMLATHLCPNTYIQSMTPSEVPGRCTMHEGVMICNESGLRATEACPVGNCTEVSEDSAPTDYCTIHIQPQANTQTNSPTPPFTSTDNQDRQELESAFSEPFTEPIFGDSGPTDESQVKTGEAQPPQNDTTEDSDKPDLPPVVSDSSDDPFALSFPE